MASERYKVMMAVLADPANFAIAQREVIKRRPSFLTPPVPKPDGGYMFVRTTEWPPANDSEPDPVSEIFETPEGWVIFSGGHESKPFPSLKEAITEAKSALSKRGFVILEEVPWEDR